jgi:hypothetical protein
LGGRCRSKGQAHAPCLGSLWAMIARGANFQQTFRAQIEALPNPRRSTLGPWSRADGSERPAIDREASIERPLWAQLGGEGRKGATTKMQQVAVGATAWAAINRRRRIIERSRSRSRAAEREGREAAPFYLGFGGGRSRQPHHSACRSVHGVWMCGSILVGGVVRTIEKRWGARPISLDAVSPLPTPSIFRL